MDFMQLRGQPLLNHLSLWVNCLRCIQAVHEGLCALRTPHVDLG